jgi:hypothetical protein
MPKVSFTNEFALEVASISDTSSSGKFFTTVPRFTEENLNTLAPPYFQYYSENENDDDKPEKFVFDMTIKGITAAEVRNVYLALSFTYKVSDRIEAEMITLGFLQISTPNGLGSARAYGSLKLKQMRPLKDEYTEKLKYNVNPLEKVLNESLSDMYYSYVIRDEYTVYDSDVVVRPYGDPNMATLHLEMYVPRQQEIQYNPTTLAALKPAWIQYIFVFILFYFVLIRYILRFIFSNQIMETYHSNNLPAEKDKRWFRQFRELEKS